MDRRHRQTAALWLVAILLTGGLLTLLPLCSSAAPDGGGRVPYRFHFEVLHTTGAEGTMIQVLRDLELELGESIEATGWLATAEGVSAYLYMWLPAGGGSAEWITMEDVHITPRYDLTAAGIEYPSGHGSAGFTLSITPPEDTPEGYYDVYIRALDGMGVPCDLAVLLNLRYGEPDRVSDEGLTVSFPRIAREGESSLLGGATVDGDQLRIPPDGRVKLGNLNLAAFETVKIRYFFPDPHAVKGERSTILGLKTAGRYSYGKDNELYNTTDSLVYAPVTTRSGEVTIRLDNLNERREIWLTGHQTGDILISEIEFIAKGYTTDRVAAHINLSGELSAYFGGFNRTSAYSVTDPVLGDVLRLEVTEATNDPYAFFRVEDLLREHDIRLSADEYKYMVLLYRADPANNHSRMNLYLCSGTILGATEDCNQGETLQKDGKWHYLLVDLSQKANWDGIIHGWRFDYISGDSDVGDGVEFASVQFFRTAQAAHKLAGRDPLEKEPYKPGDPVLILDMSEEQDSSEGEFVLDPADTVTVTEAPIEPPTEPVPFPSDTDPADSGTPDTDPADNETVTHGDEPLSPSSKKGCGSAVTVLLPLWLPLASLPLLKGRKSYTRKGEKS